MNVYDIKGKVNEILQTCKGELTKIFLVIAVISTIVGNIGDLLGGTIGSIVSIVIVLMFIPFHHGYIVSTLKATSNQIQDINVEKDSFVGFYRFKELFGTYFIYNLFLIIIMIVIMLIGLVGIVTMLPTGVIDSILDLYVHSGMGTDITAMYLTDTMAAGIASVAGFVLLMVVAILAVFIIYGLYFSLVPYVLERYNIKGVSALKESARLIKGHKGLLFRIQLSFLGYMILQVFIISSLSLMLPVPLLVSAIGAIIGVYLYQVRLTTCQTVLFEEIDYVDKQVNNQSIGE